MEWADRRNTQIFISTSDFTGRQRGVDCSVQAMQFSQGLWHKTVTQYTVLVAGDQPTGVVRWHVELESEVDPLKGNPPWSSGRLMWSICWDWKETHMQTRNQWAILKPTHCPIFSLKRTICDHPFMNWAHTKPMSNQTIMSLMDKAINYQYDKVINIESSFN